MQQTQPVFGGEEEDGQKSYNPFEDPMQLNAQEAEKDLLVQKTMSPQDTPALQEVAPAEKETDEKPGFWKKFGDKAKGIFG